MYLSLRNNSFSKQIWVRGNKKEKAKDFSYFSILRRLRAIKAATTQTSELSSSLKETVSAPSTLEKDILKRWLSLKYAQRHLKGYNT